MQLRSRKNPGPVKACIGTAGKRQAKRTAGRPTADPRVVAEGKWRLTRAARRGPPAVMMTHRPRLINEHSIICSLRVLAPDVSSLLDADIILNYIVS